MNSEITLAQATIGIVTAIPKEFAAAQLVFSPNIKVSGRSGGVYYLCNVPCIGGERIVAITVLTMMGNNCATAIATHMYSDCENIEELIMVGIAGAIPCPSDGNKHVRLGDIVVSGVSGVYQFDFGKRTDDKSFECRSTPTRPSEPLLNAVNRLLADQELQKFPWENLIDSVISQVQNWGRPDDKTDILDDGMGPIKHPHDINRRIGRPRLFVGTIASSNALIKDAKERDEIASKITERSGIPTCIEMEGSGIQDAGWIAKKSWLVVRGTCDYCNQNKNDLWQKYAALIAAAFARSIIEVMPSPSLSSSMSPTIAAPQKTILNSYGNNAANNQTIINTSEFNLQIGTVVIVVTSGSGFSKEVSSLDSFQGIGAQFFSLMQEIQRLVLQIRQELAVWNFEQAEKTAFLLEPLLANNREKLDKEIVLVGTLLLARVYINRAETKSLNRKSQVEKAIKLIEKVEKMVDSADSERLSEIFALKAAIENLEQGPDLAIALLNGRMDPYAVRTHIALLINQHKIPNAVHVLSDLEPHERWCDIAVTVYTLNNDFDKANELVRWAANLPDQNRYRQCVVRLAEAMLYRVLADHAKDVNILPSDITPLEHKQIENVVETLHPVLLPIQAAGKPNSELDVAALQIAWRSNQLLQKRETVAELMTLMMKWTPVPLNVARGVISEYIEAPFDLPTRLREEHPDDIDASILALVVQTVCLRQHKEAFRNAKEMLSLVKSDEKKEELFGIFQEIWQNLESPESDECESIARSLVKHNPKLQALFDGAIALRLGDVDKAIEILDGQKAEEDVIWLQLRGHALLKKQQLVEAVEFYYTAAKMTLARELLQLTANIAIKTEKYDIAAWCSERLSDIDPKNKAVRGNLAYLYSSILNDPERAAIHLLALHEAEPDNSKYTLNLAVCLVQLFRYQESLALFDELCRVETPSLQVVLNRAQVHHSLGNPEQALTSLMPFRTRFWDTPDFLMEYMTVAYAAGNDEAADEALKRLSQLHEQGQVQPETFRVVQKDEGLEQIKKAIDQAHIQNQHIHTEMLKGIVPWVLAEQVSGKPIYLGWKIRTQMLEWILDEPANRAQFCIYSTNGFHAGISKQGKSELLPLECSSSGTKIVADISALITLHRLGLLDAMAEFFGEILVPLGYLPIVLEDGRKLILPQRTSQTTAEQIAKQIDSGHILVLGEELEATSILPIVDEYTESDGHKYHLIDLIQPLYAMGNLSEPDFSRISHLCKKPSAVDERHLPLEQFQEMILDLTTLETIVNFNLLDAFVRFYRIRITTQAQREVLQLLNSIASQEEIRNWHMDLWNRLRSDARFRFVPNMLPEQMRQEDGNMKIFLPLLASYIAQKTNTPLLVDDRVPQALTHNAMPDVPYAAFGTDVLIMALMDAEKIDASTAVAAIQQLIAWRYRFIVPTPEVLKALADPYRSNPPGQSLRQVAEYIHDCMRDPGLFGGPEKTEMGESMAMRLYRAWISIIAEFLILVWADKEYTTESAMQLTKWSCSEFLPSWPLVMEGRKKIHGAQITPKVFLTHALLKTAEHPNEPRMTEAMNALKKGLCLADDEYMRIITGILNDSSRKVSKS